MQIGPIHAWMLVNNTRPGPLSVIFRNMSGGTKNNQDKLQPGRDEF